MIAGEAAGQWCFRLHNMPHLRTGPRIKVQYAYELKGQMPYEPIKFRILPERVKREFECDRDGYLPPTADWKKLAARSDAWNSNGLSGVIDITRRLRAQVMQNPERYVGRNHQAADGGNYGIYIVGLLPEKDDFVVMYTFDGGKIRYDEDPRRLDYFKASYRYILTEEPL